MIYLFIIFTLILVIGFCNFYYLNKIEHIKQNYDNQIDFLKQKNLDDRKLLENLHSSDGVKNLVDIMGQKLILNYQVSRKGLEETVKSNMEVFERQIFDKVKNTFEQVKTDLEKQGSLINILNKEVESSHEIRKMLYHPQKSGRLAEISLENMLISSGLIEGIDYNLQYHIKTEGGSVYKPDAIVFLPNNTKIIIDAKSSTYFFDRKKSVKLLKDQIKDLRQKFYVEKLFDDEKESSNIITFMYLPSDALLEDLYEEDATLLKMAHDSRIFLVGPMSMMHMISLARVSIYNAKKIHNFDKIFLEVEILVDKIIESKKSVLRIHNSIKNLNKDYDDFDRSFLSNICTRAENLKNHKFDAELPK